MALALLQRHGARREPVARVGQPDLTRRFVARLALVAVSAVLLVLTLDAVRDLDVVAEDRTTQLASQTFGVVLDQPANSALRGIPVPPYFEDGVSDSFSLILEYKGSGQYRGELSYAAIGEEDVLIYDIKDPATVYFALPPGAEVDLDDQSAIGIPDACAIWTDANGVHGHVEPRQLRIQHGGGKVVACELPAIGHLRQLLVQITFDYVDVVARSAGEGRIATAISTTTYPVYIDGWLADGRLPQDVLSVLPIDVELRLPGTHRMIDSFPAPTGGSVQRRVWAARDGDLEFTIEETEGRGNAQVRKELLVYLTGAALSVSAGMLLTGRPT